MNSIAINKINTHIKNFKDTLYLEFIAGNDFIKYLNICNKEYNIALHKTIEGNNIIFTGIHEQQTIYKIPVLKKYFTEQKEGEVY